MVYGDAETPSPGPGQVLVKVVATSVNMPDIIQRQGNYNPPKGDSEILGLEVAGTIQSIGDGVSGWQTGDRVMALIGGGGYAEYALAHTGHLIRIPENMSFEQAACVCETYLTAYLNLFMLAKLGGEEFALLHGGGGGVNTAAIHLCKHLSPGVTTIVTASTGKVDRVQALGAHHVIDYRTQSFPEEVKRITSGAGVDVILDHIGAKYLADNMKSLGVYGRLLQIGVTSGPKAELNLALMMVKRQRIIGSVLRPRSIDEKTEIIQSFTKAALDHMANGAITPLISSTYPLEHAADAHREMEASTHFGKIVLCI